LTSIKVEDVLEFFGTFEKIVSTLALPKGPKGFCLVLAMMGHDAQIKWFDVVTNYTTNKTQEEFEDCIKKPSSIYESIQFFGNQGMDVMYKTLFNELVTFTIL
jgi:hypothetical protein